MGTEGDVSDNSVDKACGRLQVTSRGDPWTHSAASRLARVISEARGSHYRSVAACAPLVLNEPA
jgi:hypothetical protein